MTNTLSEFSEYLFKNDPKLSYRLHPLCMVPNDDGELLFGSIAVEDLHYSKDDWHKFLNYAKQFRKQKNI